MPTYRALFVPRVPIPAWGVHPASRGVGFLVAGAAAQAGLSPAIVTGACGLVGTAAVTTAAVVWKRAEISAARH